MTAILLCSDLFFASQLGATGRGLVTVANTEELLSTITNETRLVILDLTSNTGDLVELVSRIRQEGVRQPRIVAFAPHVHTERLAAAKDAGCDQVLSRGQITREIGQLLTAASG